MSDSQPTINWVSNGKRYPPVKPLPQDAPDLTPTLSFTGTRLRRTGRDAGTNLRELEIPAREFPAEPLSVYVRRYLDHPIRFQHYSPERDGSLGWYWSIGD